MSKHTLPLIAYTLYGIILGLFQDQLLVKIFHVTYVGYNAFFSGANGYLYYCLRVKRKLFLFCYKS